MEATDSLLVLTECRSALAEAREFNDVRAIRDKAEATRLLLQIRGESVLMQNEAAELAILAEIKLGESLAVMDKLKGGRRKKTPDTRSGVSLEEIGVSHKQSSRWQSMAAAKSKVAALRREADEQDKELTRAAVYKLGRKILTGDKPKPTSNVWSVGEWIEHLRNKVESVYEEAPAEFRGMMANVLRSLAENVEAWESTEDEPDRGGRVKATGGVAAEVDRTGLVAASP